MHNAIMNDADREAATETETVKRRADNQITDLRDALKAAQVGNIETSLKIDRL